MHSSLVMWRFGRQYSDYISLADDPVALLMLNSPVPLFFNVGYSLVPQYSDAMVHKAERSGEGLGSNW